MRQGRSVNDHQTACVRVLASEKAGLAVRTPNQIPQKVDTDPKSSIAHGARRVETHLMHGVLISIHV